MCFYTSCSMKYGCGGPNHFVLGGEKGGLFIDHNSHCYSLWDEVNSSSSIIVFTHKVNTTLPHYIRVQVLVSNGSCYLYRSISASLNKIHQLIFLYCGDIYHLVKIRRINHPANVGKRANMTNSTI